MRDAVPPSERAGRERGGARVQVGPAVASRVTFLNPLLLAGLAAVAIPIAIHLFNFRRPQRIDFSTLRFLRELEATAMRRVRIRQWVLLALRALAVVFLVLAFAAADARPPTRARSRRAPLGAWSSSWTTAGR